MIASIGDIVSKTATIVQGRIGFWQAFFWQLCYDSVDYQ
jgi:hypothetical protein